MQPLLRSTSDVLNIKDTIDDTRDTFSPSRLNENFSVVDSIRQQARDTKDSLMRFVPLFLSPLPPSHLLSPLQPLGSSK
jgi:hypothetical protein